ncbi:thiamine diphosphokinase [Paenibacillus nasutitermitis]|uniref:thiamine diphosphokinase n=1 Tax=Paenibacillus nasutitermitis TaxID=1652958 RepID=UPI00166A7588|nr:thiamine diphosphokinase [Paenibacillus nasutitermitis]
MTINRILIFSGGALGSWALDEIRQDDYIIGADAGALFLVNHGTRPHLSLGDFDSVTPEQLMQIQANSGETLPCDPIDKNFTDTELAWNLALSKQPSKIILFGALGTRFDHSLANVHLLRSALQLQIDAVIMDNHNRISLITDWKTIEDRQFTYVSLLPLSETVTGITLTGFQYPLNEATLTIGQSLGISNVMEASQAVIRIREGMLLVIESRD